MALTFGQTAAMGGINFGLNAIASTFGNQAARDNAIWAANMNYKLGEKAADNADARTRRLYEDYQSPEALLKQYKEAGLSPSLMFGGGGAGGTTLPSGAMGTGSAGMGVQTFGVNPVDMAQVNLMNAEAKKAEAEAKTEEATREGKVKDLEATISQKIATTDNIGLKNVWQEFQNSIEMFDLTFAASTTEEKIRQFFKDGEILNYKAKSAKAKGEIDEATKEDVKKYIQQQTLNLVADTLLKKANIAYTNEQKEQLSEYLQLHKDELQLGKDTLQNDKDKFAKQVEQWGTENGFTKDQIKLMLADTIIGGVGKGFDMFMNVLKFLSEISK